MLLSGKGERFVRYRLLNIRIGYEMNEKGGEFCYLRRRKKRLQEGKINTNQGRNGLAELARLFIRLGFTAFGGPAAHIAMMEEEVVRRRGWFTHEEYLDMLGVTNLIPGPNSTEMAIHIGYRRGGVKGLVTAGVCFIIPAMIVTIALAWLYTTYGMIPALGPAMQGIRAGIIAVILGAVYRLAKPFASRPFMIVTGAAAAILVACRVDPLLILLGAAAAGMAWTNREKLASLFAFAPALPFMTPGDPAGAANAPTLTGLGLFLLKTGAILYGGGYVLVAFLQQGLVDSRGWLTQARLLDAIAVGQFTPGPVLSTATFIGYLLFGIPGAIVCTFAIFFPSFLYVLAVGPFVPRLRASVLMKGFLDGASAGALGLMTGVCYMLGVSSLTGAGSAVIFGAALFVLIRWRVGAAWIVGGGALAGWAFGLAGLL
jgi:chromate transporter